MLLIRNMLKLCRMLYNIYYACKEKVIGHFMVPPKDKKVLRTTKIRRRGSKAIATTEGNQGTEK